jgi:hypothetical protein
MFLRLEPGIRFLSVFSIFPEKKGKNHHNLWSLRTSYLKNTYPVGTVKISIEQHI